MSADPVIDREPTAQEIIIAKRILARAGYVCLKLKSHQQAQERQRVAEAMAKDAREREQSNDRWWRETILPELFEYRDRVTFLYGAARAAGCSVDELGGEA